jgi:hypothetical protein
MQSPNDWKNIEMTGYVKLLSTTGSSFAINKGGWTWEARGARHTGDTLLMFAMALHIMRTYSGILVMLGGKKNRGMLILYLLATILHQHLSGSKNYKDG